MQENKKIQHLSNGIVVLTEQVPELQSFSLGFYVLTGARYERKEESGISHFIEHLLFKGTKTRTAKEISDCIDNEGGNINAYTSRENTVYYVKALSSKLEIAIDVLSDMFLHSTFSEENIEKERNVIIEEIRMYEDSPEDTIHDENIQFALRGIQSNSISGTPESLEKIGRKEILEYIKEQYVASNVVIAISGRFDEEVLMKELEKKMSALPKSKFRREFDTSYSFARGKKVIRRESQQVHLCVNSRGVESNSKFRYAAAILSYTLGGGMSARLFQKIREEQGLAYSVYSYMASFEECGLFTTYAGTTKEDYPKVLEDIFKEYAAVREQGITAEELQRGKNQFASALMFNLENSRGRMSSLANGYLLRGKLEDTDEIIRKINEVSLEDIQEVAKYMFEEDYYSYTILGNVKEEEVL